MQVSETLSEGLKREFKVLFTAAEIEERIDTRIGELLPTLNLPGFRRGKVPAKLVKQRFGPAIRGEVLEKLLEDSSRDTLSERELTPIGQPQLAVTQYEEGGDLEYTLSLELRPAIAPIDFGALTLERLTIEDSDAAVQEIIERQARSVRLSETEGDIVVEPDDRLVVDLVGRIDGETFPQGDRDDLRIRAGAASEDFPGLGEQLVGLSVRDPAPVTIIYPDDIKWPELAGKEAVFEVRITDIDRPVAFDEAFAQEKLGYETIEQYREDVRARRVNAFEHGAHDFLKRTVLDWLESVCDFEMPEGLVEREYQSICGVWLSRSRATAAAAAPAGDSDEQAGAEAGVAETAAAAVDSAPPAAAETPDVAAAAGEGDGQTADSAPPPADEGIEEWRKAGFRKTAVRRVKLGLALDETARLNNISVSEAESTMIRNQLTMQQLRTRPYDPQSSGQPPEWMVQRLTQQVYEDKVIDFIVELATVSEKTVTPEAFEAIVMDQDAADWAAGLPAA